MYRKFYGLTKKPFHTTPDPYFLFLSPSHKEALGAMAYGIDHRKGFVAITGEVGVGKTTIVRSFLEQVDWQEEHTSLIYIFNPTLTVNELLKSILSELGQEPISGSDAELVNRLQKILIEKYRQQGTVVLLIDEAQNMPPKTLEHLRMLSNLETSTDKLIQIILIGQPELETLLAQREMRQLRQRIAVRATIQPLTKEESLAYIIHRLAQAGLTGKHIFHKSALELIVKQAAGIPRRLNILCDNALITGLGYRQNPVSAKIAREVIADIDKQPTKRRWAWIPAAAGVLLFLLGAAWVASIDKPDTIHAVKKDKIEAVTTKSQEMKTPQDEARLKGDDGLLSTTVNKQNVSLEVSVDKPMSQQGAAAPKRVSPSIADHQTRTVRQEETFANDTRNTLHAVRKNESGSLAGIAQNMKTLTDGVKQKGNGVILASTVNEQSVPPEVLIEEPMNRQVPVPKRTSPSKPNDQIRIIERGDTLGELIMEVYGTSNPELVHFVLRHNPDIIHIRKIIPGQKVTFPQLDAFARDQVKKAPLEAETIPPELERNNLRPPNVILTQSAEKPTQRLQPGTSATKPLATRIIQEGDTLSRLVRSIYGSTDPERVKQVLKYNPHIRNARKIFPGQEVLFPKLSRLGSKGEPRAKNP